MGLVLLAVEQRVTQHSDARAQAPARAAGGCGSLTVVSGEAAVSSPHLGLLLDPLVPLEPEGESRQSLAARLEPCLLASLPALCGAVLL